MLAESTLGVFASLWLYFTHPCKIIQPHIEDYKKNEIPREETLTWHEYMSMKHVTPQATTGETEKPKETFQREEPPPMRICLAIENLNCSVFPVVNNAF